MDEIRTNDNTEEIEEVSGEYIYDDCDTDSDEEENEVETRKKPKLGVIAGIAALGTAVVVLGYKKVLKPKVIEPIKAKIEKRRELKEEKLISKIVSMCNNNTIEILERTHLIKSADAENDESVVKTEEKVEEN